MARIFLGIVAGITGLAILGAVLFAAFRDDIQLFAMTQMIPSMSYDEATLPAAPDYGEAASWLVRPGAEGAARTLPAGEAPAAPIAADVFFIHPTTYLGNEYWNAPIDEPSATATLPRVIAAQMTPFAAAEGLYAPRYRQAAFGAFMAANTDTFRALLTAYGDIERAFDSFLAMRDEERPFILAGHSQGAILGLWLLKNRIAGTPLAKRMIAAFLPGWTFSLEEDIAALADIGPCRSPEETGCILGWQSFASDGDTTLMKAAFASQIGLSGRPKAGSTMLCVNPLSFRMDRETVPAALHLGAVATDEGGGLAAPRRELFSAGCDADGFLRLSPAPPSPFDEILLPGRNYHVYDIHLFHMNIRANLAVRAASMDAGTAAFHE